VAATGGRLGAKTAAMAGQAEVRLFTGDPGASGHWTTLVVGLGITTVTSGDIFWALPENMNTMLGKALRVSTRGPCKGGFTGYTPRCRDS
jgi:hypothetical protein